MRSTSVHSEIEQHLHALASEDKRPYQICRELAACTRQLMEKEDVRSIKNCFRQVLTLYRRSTSNTIRMAIQNVFLYTVGTRLHLSAQRRLLLNLLPTPFRTIVIGQMTALDN